MARLDMPLDDVLHARAKAEAALQLVSLREYVARALAEKLERDERTREKARKRPR